MTAAAVALMLAMAASAFILAAAAYWGCEIPLWWGPGAGPLEAPVAAAIALLAVLGGTGAALTFTPMLPPGGGAGGESKM